MPECRLEFGTPRGAVEVELDIAAGFGADRMPELFEASRHIIDADVAKTYQRPS
jgi:hypothetical protein